MVLRIITAALLLLIGNSVAAPVISSAAALSEEGSITYRIERKGKTIGHHRVVRTQDEQGRYHVDISFSIRVKFAFITAFKMDHQASELWTSDGKLLNLHAFTDRKSGQFDVRVNPLNDEDGFNLVVNGKQEVAPPELTPTSFTFPQALFVGEERPVLLLDTLSGFLKPSTIHPHDKVELELDGRTIETDYYEITYDETGDVTHRIWVDDNLTFLKLGLFTKDGHYIEYFREDA
ncbi:MAG: DUF6134 family protein [Sphingomonadales bacterium]|jgi:hypothetical protein